ncbi:MAG: four helix bundle protein [Kofleriaceae bacterium]|nr:four helix bundle protein [Kofleriaceae bacterium]
MPRNHRPHAARPLKLDVYARALDLLDLVDQIHNLMPAGRAHRKDQLDRAATSVVLNIAEGAGEFSRDEKQRFYRMARRSATETAAILDILDRRKAVAASVLSPDYDGPLPQGGYFVAHARTHLVIQRRRFGLQVRLRSRSRA